MTVDNVSRNPRVLADELGLPTKASFYFLPIKRLRATTKCGFSRTTRRKASVDQLLHIFMQLCAESSAQAGVLLPKPSSQYSSVALKRVGREYRSRASNRTGGRKEARLT